MKYIALAFNVLFMGWIAFMLSTEKGPHDLRGWLVLLMFIATPVASITAIVRTPQKTSAFRSWISLVLERKRLEERAKVAALRQ